MIHRIQYGLVLASLMALLPAAAGAEGFSLKIEPGLALPLSAPQSELFDVGFTQSIKGLFGVSSYLDLGPSVSMLYLDGEEPGDEAGVAWAFGLGARLHRPKARGVSPWLDAGALYIRTGELNRPGFDVGVGLAIPVDDEHRFWVGPFARYMQTIQPARDGFDNRDAKIFIAGLSFEAGPGSARRHARVEPPIEPIEPIEPPAPVEVVTIKEVPVIQEVAVCADGDADGVPDSVDRCPEKAGSVDGYGCPEYKRVVVRQAKLEVKEKFFFDYNKSKILPAAYPALDEVVLALQDNPRIRVQIEGHTDSRGREKNNQRLSEARAKAVHDYLEAKGIAAERMTYKGFASSQPLDTNETVRGREYNRRVEFVTAVSATEGGAK